MPGPAIAPLEFAALTHPGKVRQQNEDCIAADAAARLAVLADGMGGHNAGEVASRMAVEIITSNIGSERGDTALDSAGAEALIASHVIRANSTLLATARSDPQYEGMGTTLVVVLWHDEGVSYGNVGDSRLYLLRAGELRQLTRDHSIVQEQVERGTMSLAEARHAPHRNVLTRALGIDPFVEAEVRTAATEPGDLYLLCSDGLTDMLTDDEIRQALVADHDPLAAAAQRLVERANENGGLDNISVVLARVAPERRGA